MMMPTTSGGPSAASTPAPTAAEVLRGLESAPEPVEDEQPPLKELVRVRVRGETRILYDMPWRYVDDYVCDASAPPPPSA